MPTQKNLIGTGCAPAQAIASVGVPAVGLTAVGSTQGTAYIVSTDFNIFTTTGTGTGAILAPCGTSGNSLGLADTIVVINHGANALALYPPVGGSIQNQSVNTPTSVPAGKAATALVVGANLYACSVSS